MPASTELNQTVASDKAGRLDAVLRALTGLSHGNTRGLIQQGAVSVDGVVCTDIARRVEPGTRIHAKFEPGRRYHEKPHARASRHWRLVFEDEQVLVVDKAAGILTVPNHDEPDTLAGLLTEYLRRGKGSGRRPPGWVGVGVVHRLDRETSGLLVFAKDPGVCEAIKEQFMARKPERLYVAVVAGALREEAGTFRSHLATDGALNQHSTDDPDEGKLAVTHYAVTGRGRGWTAVAVRLETGRRNQIRVHFAEAGHPVLGDGRYRPELAHHPDWKPRRLALHAAVLGFTHPVTGHPLRFESPLPPEMAVLLKRIPNPLQTPPGLREPGDATADSRGPSQRPAAPRRRSASLRGKSQPASQQRRGRNA